MATTDVPASDPPVPGQAAPGPAPASGRPAWLVWVAAAAVVVVAAGVVLALTRSSGTATYDDASRARFLDACTADSGPPARPACACLYDRIVTSVSFSRFEQVSADLAAAGTPAGQPVTLPPDIDQMRAACVASTSTGR